MLIETPNEYNAFPDDVRNFYELALKSYMRENTGKKTFVFCNNKDYKRTIKDLFPSIRIIDHYIGHTSYINITEKQMKNTIVDFYLIYKSEKIIAASKSGFSEVASYFTIPLLYEFKIKLIL